MMRTHLAMISAALLAGCAGKSPPAPPSSPPSRTAPPPTVREEGPTLPPDDGKGGFRTINSGLTEAEALWHLRSALNVGALACDKAAAPKLVGDYNGFLKEKAKPLATAYAAETARFEDPRALDLHMTQLYNYFAQPAAAAGFCKAVGPIGSEARATPASALPGYAEGAIVRLEQPFQAHYARWRDYRVALAAWREGQAARPPAAPPAEPPIAVAARATAPATASSAWRIQLGAFSGADAARGAWTRIKGRQPGFARYAPSYEPIDGARLVRVRIGPARDRADAIAMCATAAAAGLDCLPVSP